MTLSIFASVILIGLGATAVFDLWGLLLKKAFGIPPSNICLIGRWILHMRHGIFKHSNIVSTPAKDGECVAGWVAHYTIGVTLAAVFLAVVGIEWIEHPTLGAALLYGTVTVMAPFGILQPAFGFGFAASRTPNPAQARLRSVMNHLAFGLGLYLSAVLAGW